MRSHLFQLEIIEDSVKVGDSVDDMTAGYTAGAATVLLANEVNSGLKGHEHTGSWIHRLDELIMLLENGFEESKELG